MVKIYERCGYRCLVELYTNNKNKIKNYKLYLLMKANNNKEILIVDCLLIRKYIYGILFPIKHWGLVFTMKNKNNKFFLVWESNDSNTKISIHKDLYWSKRCVSGKNNKIFEENIYVKHNISKELNLEELLNIISNNIFSTYNLITHNCQHFIKNIIKKLINKS